MKAIEIPVSVRNNNCVQDAAARLREVIAMFANHPRRHLGAGDRAIGEARANLQGWIDHALKGTS